MSRACHPDNYRIGWGKWLRHAFCLMPLLALVGCSRFGGNGMLEITPSVFSACQGVDISVHVAWDATAALKKKEGVKLFIYKPGRQPQLWIQAGAKGDVDTPKWASDGWTITLVSGHGHKVLATRTLQSTPCRRH